MRLFFSYFYLDESVNPPRRVEVNVDDGDMQERAYMIQASFNKLVEDLVSGDNAIPSPVVTVISGNVEGIGEVPYQIINNGYPKSLQRTPNLSHAGMMNRNVISPAPKSQSQFVVVGANTTEYWRAKQRRAAQWIPCVPTGIYVKPNETIKIHVNQSDATFGCFVGTFGIPSSATSNFQPTKKKLNQGENTISDSLGGLLYFSNEHPVGTTITATVTSGGSFAPLYILDTHSFNDFKNILSQPSLSNLVEFKSRRGLVTIFRNTALKYFNNVDPAPVLRKIDESIDLEDTVSGISASLPEPHKPDPHLLAMVEHPACAYWMYAWGNVTGYCTDSIDRLLNLHHFTTDGWGPWHEQGHTRQMPPWRWSGPNENNVVEVTVNIYSLYVQRAFGNQSRLKVEGVYPKVMTYLNRPTRDFHSFDDVFIKLAMFWQLDLAFGKNFYPKLHQICRLMVDENPILIRDQQQHFVLLACLTADRNLEPFFNAWGFKMTQKTLDKIRKFPPLQKEIWKNREDTGALIVEYTIPDNYTLPPIPPTAPPPNINGQKAVIITANRDSAVIDASGTNAVIWDRHDNDNQIWEFIHEPSNNTYLIKNTKFNTYLSEGSGRKAVLTGTISNSSRWLLEFIPGSGSVYHIRNVSSNMYLDVPASNTQNGTQLITYPFGGSANQSFGIEPLNQTSPEIPEVKNGSVVFYVIAQGSFSKAVQITALNKTFSLNTGGSRIESDIAPGTYTVSVSAPADENYEYTISAPSSVIVSSNAQSIVNIYVNATAITKPPTQGTLSAPTNLNATPLSSSSINLTWIAPLDTSKIMNYEIYRNNTKIAEVPVGTNTYLDQGLSANTTYTYTVKSSAISNFSNTEVGQTTSETQAALQPPTNLRESSKTANSISLLWNLPAQTANIQGFRIYRNNQVAGSVSQTQTSFTDTGLSANTTYSYRVASYGNSLPEATTGSINITTNPQVATGGVSYQISGEGGWGQNLTLINKGTTAIPANYKVEYDFSGNAPNPLWPSSNIQTSGNRQSFTMGGTLQPSGRTTIQLTANPNTRLSNIKVNGVLATRE